MKPIYLCALLLLAGCESQNPQTLVSVADSAATFADARKEFEARNPPDAAKLNAAFRQFKAACDEARSAWPAGSREREKLATLESAIVSGASEADIRDLARRLKSEYGS
jgi:hypothetical protein